MQGSYTSLPPGARSPSPFSMQQQQNATNPNHHQNSSNSGVNQISSPRQGAREPQMLRKKPPVAALGILRALEPTPQEIQHAQQQQYPQYQHHPRDRRSEDRDRPDLSRIHSRSEIGHGLSHEDRKKEKKGLFWSGRGDKDKDRDRERDREQLESRDRERRKDKEGYVRVEKGDRDGEEAELTRMIGELLCCRFTYFFPAVYFTFTSVSYPSRGSAPLNQRESWLSCVRFTDHFLRYRFPNSNSFRRLGSCPRGVRTRLSK